MAAPTPRCGTPPRATCRRSGQLLRRGQRPNSRLGFRGGCRTAGPQGPAVSIPSEGPHVQRGTRGTSSSSGVPVPGWPKERPTARVAASERWTPCPVEIFHPARCPYLEAREAFLRIGDDQSIRELIDGPHAKREEALPREVAPRF